MKRQRARAWIAAKPWIAAIALCVMPKLLLPLVSALAG